MTNTPFPLEIQNMEKRVYVITCHSPRSKLVLVQSTQAWNKAQEESLDMVVHGWGLRIRDRL